MFGGVDAVQEIKAGNRESSRVVGQKRYGKLKIGTEMP